MAPQAAAGVQERSGRVEIDFQSESRAVISRETKSHQGGTVGLRVNAELAPNEAQFLARRLGVEANRVASEMRRKGQEAA